MTNFMHDYDYDMTKPEPRLRLTGRAVLLLGLPAAILLGLTAGQATIPDKAEVTDRGYTIDVYEDGSGVIYQGTNEVFTLPEGTLPWDCTTDGNQICG